MWQQIRFQLSFLKGPLQQPDWLLLATALLALCTMIFLQCLFTDGDFSLFFILLYYKYNPWGSSWTTTTSDERFIAERVLTRFLPPDVLQVFILQFQIYNLFVIYFHSKLQLLTVCRMQSHEFSLFSIWQCEGFVFPREEMISENFISCFI